MICFLVGQGPSADASSMSSTGLRKDRLVIGSTIADAEGSGLIDQFGTAHDIPQVS
jgi:hypothetical protein